MSANDETNDSEQPTGRFRPESGELGEIHGMLVDQEYEEALDRAEEAEPGTPLEGDWLGYLRGLALLGTRELEQAYESFRSTAEKITSASTKSLEPDRYRVAAKCLKKMGWYHRRGEGHARAYAYHEMEYELIEEHGSPLELHDAALSLDVVSYHLRTPQISRKWIRRSIDAGADIEGESARRKALGISWNNMTGTLCDLGDFEEAGEAAETSLEHWRAYEELEGPDENRLVWAKHIFGDAFKRWGDHLAAQGDEEGARAKLERAKTALEEAVAEAEERGMSESDRDDIEGKLHDVLRSFEGVGGVDEASDGEDSDAAEADAAGGDEGDDEADAEPAGGDSDAEDSGEESDDAEESDEEADANKDEDSDET